MNTLSVHDLSAVNDYILRFKYSSTVAIRFATSTVALTGETISTLPDMYHEISVALPVSGWTLIRIVNLQSIQQTQAKPKSENSAKKTRAARRKKAA